MFWQYFRRLHFSTNILGETTAINLHVMAYPSSVHGQDLGRNFKINILGFGGVKPYFSPVQWVTAVPNIF